MPKKKSGSKRRHDEAWTGLDHAIRVAKLSKSKKDGEEEQLTYQQRRKAALTRDSQEQQDAHKLRLHIVKTEREIERLRQRLQAWDDVEEDERGNEKKKKRHPNTNKRNRRRKREERDQRLGSYEELLVLRTKCTTLMFDMKINMLKLIKKLVRKQRDLATFWYSTKAAWARKATMVHRNQQVATFWHFSCSSGTCVCKRKSTRLARAAFIECMDLDGTEQPITPARCHLMRLYLEANRPESARRLWEKLPNDTSVWIRYSAALVEYVSWNLLKEEGSTRESAEALLAKAIRANVFCAYYLAFSETFDTVMEYTDDIEESHEESLEEAIEYCCSEQRGAWTETEGSIEWLREAILRALHGGNVAGLTKADLEWENRLDHLVEAQENDEDTDDADNEEAESHDLKMFAGMFITGMEMLQEAGAFTNTVPDPTVEGGVDGDGSDSDVE